MRLGQTLHVARLAPRRLGGCDGRGQIGLCGSLRFRRLLIDSLAHIGRLPRLTGCPELGCAQQTAGAAHATTPGCGKPALEEVTAAGPENQPAIGNQGTCRSDHLFLGVFHFGQAHRAFRLEIGLELMRAAGASVELPGGGFYLWAQAPDGDAWALARTLAERSGVIVSPGEFYGARTDHVRFAAVQPTSDLRLALERIQG